MLITVDKYKLYSVLTTVIGNPKLVGLLMTEVLSVSLDLSFIKILNPIYSFWENRALFSKYYKIIPCAFKLA